MRPSLLPVVLLTTITLSSSNVLPILTINKLETEPFLEDQNTRPDTTFNNKHKENPNIFYKVFIGTPKDNLPKKSQISRLKIFDNYNNQVRAFLEDLDADDDFNSEGSRTEQWHLRRLDRLNENNLYKQLGKELLDIIDSETLTKDKDSRNEFNRNTRDDVLEGYDSGIIDGPLFVFKIRLAYLTNNINQAHSNKHPYATSPLDQDDSKHEENLRDNKIFIPNQLASIIKVKRNEKIREFPQFSEKSSNENKSVKKRIFSLWSRLQSLSHRGHELQHRRHLYAFYGLPEDGGSALTAETRATLLRPPGSPLRWG